MFNTRFIIAEIGNNHEGSIQVIKKLITEAKIAGANAVKLQFIDPEKFIAKDDTKRLKQLKKFSITKKQFVELKKYAQKNKIILFATPFDIDGAKFLNQHQKLFKISSADNNFFQLMDVVRSFNKPVIVSLGLAQSALVKKIVNFFREKKFYRSSKNFCIMHCVSDYPTKKTDININTIHYLQKKYKNVTIGFSDHTLGYGITKIAYIAGAKIIEKHFTLSNNFSTFRDHKLSLNPKTLRKLINDINDLDRILGQKKIIVSKNEILNSKLYRRKIFIKKNLKLGTTLQSKHFSFLRSNVDGMQIDELRSILGKKLNKNLPKNSIIKKSDIIK